jgi:hypothetical protein
MIKIITTKTLAALRAEASLVPGLRRSAAAEAEARQSAADDLAGERAARARAETERDTALDDVTAGLARLELAASDPADGEAVKAAIALHAMRTQIARVKASGDPAAIEGVRVLDALIGPDPETGSNDPEQPKQPTHQEDTTVAPETLDTVAPETLDPILKYHHPHFISAEHNTWGTKYTFRGFTGSEPEPQSPDAAWKDDSLSWEERRLVDREYEAARCMWSQAGFRRDAAAAITSAVPVWQAYARARSAMDAAFAAFWETGDGQWRAQILRLTDAHEQALRAARDWDDVADRLARMQYEHFRYVGEGNELGLKDVGAGVGIDTTSWFIDFYYYSNERHGDTLASKVREAIDGHKDRLREVAELAPQHSGGADPAWQS